MKLPEKYVINAASINITSAKIVSLQVGKAMKNNRKGINRNRIVVVLIEPR